MVNNKTLAREICKALEDKQSFKIDPKFLKIARRNAYFIDYAIFKELSK